MNAVERIQDNALQLNAWLFVHDYQITIFAGNYNFYVFVKLID